MALSDQNCLISFVLEPSDKTRTRHEHEHDRTRIRVRVVLGRSFRVRVVFVSCWAKIFVFVSFSCSKFMYRVVFG